MLEVFAPLEHSLLYQVFDVELIAAHPRPDFGNQQAYVVVHAVFHSQIPRAAQPPVVAGQRERDEGRV